MKKSHSAIFALSSTIHVSSQHFGGYLNLSDSEDDECLAPPPKRFKSDSGSLYCTQDKTSQHISSEFIALDAQTSHVEPERVSALFAETPVASSGALLAPELDLDIENAHHEVSEREKPDIYDYCSSSSEFELDSDDDFKSAASVPSCVSLSNSSIISESYISTCELSATAHSSTSQHVVDISPPPHPRFSSSTSQKRAQSTITNYFGIQHSDGSVKKTSTVCGSVSPSPVAPNPTPSSHFADFKSLGGTSSTPSYSSKVRETCPFYKRIAGTTFIVDDFRFIYNTPQTNSFFLTHFHSDHYQGLTSRFDRGLIYCSTVTANLVLSSLRVRPQYVRTIPWRVPTMVEGVEVTLFDANHCPGAALLLFRLPDGSLHLHTGDFRFDSDMPDHLSLLELAGRIVNLYLDTTYANPTYIFPHQQLVISSVLDLLTPYARDSKTLFIVGTYTIGKERMFFALAERFSLKFYCKPSKMKILKCLEIDPIINEFATTDEEEARIHVVPIFDISIKKLEAFLDLHKNKWTRVIAIRPTGWTFEKSGGQGRKSHSTPSMETFITLSSSSSSSASSNSSSPSSSKAKMSSVGSMQKSNAGISTTSARRGAVTIHSAPYSEHSSFSELCTFVRSLRPKWIIPTVNNRSREAVVEMVKALRG